MILYLSQGRQTRPVVCMFGEHANDASSLVEPNSSVFQAEASLHLLIKNKKFEIKEF